MYNIWILKPGENTNRGDGIHVCKTMKEVKALVLSTLHEKYRTWIIQRYMDNSLLIHRRKFDIRMFALVTCVNGYQKGYFYRVGYLRTSSKEFTMDDLSDKYVHLTNDSI
jgi:tubulin--tyrosine ligase